MPRGPACDVGTRVRVTAAGGTLGRAGEAPHGSRHASGGARAAAAPRRRLSGRGPTGRGARRRLPPWSPRVWCGAASGGLRRRPRLGARGPRAPPVPVTRRGRGAGARRPPFAGEAFVRRGAAARRAWAALPAPREGRGRGGAGPHGRRRWACARLASLGARCSFPRQRGFRGWLLSDRAMSHQAGAFTLVGGPLPVFALRVIFTK